MGEKQATTSDGEAPGTIAARAARGRIEEALFALPEIPLRLDREDLRDRLLRGVERIYVVLDTAVVAVAHLDGLREAAATAAECAAILSRAGDPAAVPALGRAVDHLVAADRELRAAADAVAAIQLARRAEIVFGAPDVPLPAPRPFRASRGVPSLHAFARRPLAPHVVVDPLAPPPEDAPPPPPLPPRPRTLDELAAFAEAAASGELARRMTSGAEPGAAAVRRPPPFAFEPAIEEVEVLRRLARDCLEDVAVGRSLRKPNAIERWLDQAPFEQRLLDNLDAFAALGGSALPQVSLFVSEAKTPDPERAFAAALVLGSIEGRDTVGAAVTTLKQSAPETYPGWVEGLWLAPSPAIDPAMIDLCDSPRPALVAVALDVMRLRATPADAVVARFLGRREPEIVPRVARALATALPREDAVAALIRIADEADDDEAFLAAVESLLRRGHAAGLDRIRSVVHGGDQAAGPRRDAAAFLLCLAGRGADLPALLEIAASQPSPQLLRGLGRFGHAGVIPALADALAAGDEDLAAAAAEALDRITGAGLREIVEEDWEVELPPEAEGSGAIPVPKRKVERVVTDPARWSAWIADNAGALDPRRKLRAGGLFTPALVVDELEAGVTPPARRHEAALELYVVTGVASPFSPDDWVARQQEHLSALRSDVAARGLAPGAWPFSAGLDDAPRPARPRRAPPAPPRPDPAPPLAAPPPIAAPLPPLAAPPPIAAPPPAVPPPPPAARPAAPIMPDATVLGAISPFAAGAALPFRNADGKPAEPARQSTGAMAAVTAPVLPFKPKAPGEESAGAPEPAAAAPDAPALPASDGGTGLPQPSPFRDVPLPFRPAPAAPPPAAPPPAAPPPAAASLKASLAQTTIGTVISPLASLPFAATGKPAAPAPPAPPRNDAALPFAAPAPAPAQTPPPPAPPQPAPAPAAQAPLLIGGLTLEQHASLCAELAYNPAVENETFARYRVTREGKAGMDRQWKERFAADPALEARFRKAYLTYFTFLTTRRG